MNFTKKIQASAIGVMLVVIFVAGSMQTAEAAMISNNVRTWTLKGEPSTVQMVGTANYPTFHYVIMSVPANGQIPSYDGVTGEAFYQPNAGFTGVDSFTYRIVSNYNSAWFSNTATVKIAVVENWTEYYPAATTPVLMSDYVIAKGLNASTVNEIPGVTNIEPYKQTPQGHINYVNVKAAYELAGQNWWDLTLGQKMWLMENLYYKTGQWAGVYN